MEEFFILEKSMGNNLWGGITDSIIAEEGAPASGYFEGQFKEVANLFWVTSLCVLELNTLIYVVSYAFCTIQLHGTE